MGKSSNSSEVGVITDVDHWGFSAETFLDFLDEPSWVAAFVVVVVIALNFIWLVVWQALAEREAG